MTIDHIDPNDPRWEISEICKRGHRAGGATKASRRRSGQRQFLMPAKVKKPAKRKKVNRLTAPQKTFLRELGYNRAQLAKLSPTRAQKLIDGMTPPHMARLD